MIRNALKKLLGGNYTENNEKLAILNFAIVILMFVVSGIMLFVLPPEISILQSGGTYYPIPSVLGVWLFPVISLLINMLLIKQKRLSKMNTVIFALLFVVMMAAYCHESLRSLMTDKTLLKILTKRKPSIIFSVSGLIAGIYAGFMVWYALKTYIPGPLHTHLSYLAVIVLGISAFIAVYQIPDLLFANEKIEHVLPLPIDSGTVIFVLLKKVICLQAELCIAVYWAGFLFCFRNALAVSFAVLYCLIMLVSLNLLVFLLSVAIGTITPHRSVGYVFLVLQFAGPIVLLLDAGAGMTMVPMLTSRSVTLILCSSLTIAAGTLFVAARLRTKINACYLLAYQNVQGFQRKNSMVHSRNCLVRNHTLSLSGSVLPEIRHCYFSQTSKIS